MKFPKTQPWLVLHSFVEETLIYDASKGMAHNLNSSASLVFHYCQEQTSYEEALLNFRLKLQLETATAEDLLKVCLGELEEKGLLMDASADRGIPRRSFLLKWGATAALLPLITSLSLPTAASAASACNCGTLPTVTANVVRTCVSGTRTHTFDLSGSTAISGCNISRYFYDINNDGGFEFSSDVQSSLVFTYSGTVTGNVQASFTVQGPCGAGDVSSTTLAAFPVVCP